jgi:hypothetical protein
MNRPTAYPAAFIEPKASSMTPAQLRQWRTERWLLQRDAAALLGLALRIYHRLERGIAGSRAEMATIPRTIELAVRGLDAEMGENAGASDLGSLRAVYARAVDDRLNGEADRRGA